MDTIQGKRYESFINNVCDTFCDVNTSKIDVAYEQIFIANNILPQTTGSLKAQLTTIRPT